MIYSSEIEATKITSKWYLWIHHTIDKIPDEKNLYKVVINKDVISKKSDPILIYSNKESSQKLMSNNS